MIGREMKRFVDVINRISTTAGYVSAVFGLLILILILAEIISRTIFSTSLLLAIEVSSWLLIVLVFMGAAWTRQVDGQVQIKLFLSRLTVGGKHLANLCLAGIGVVAFSLFSVYAWLRLVELYVGGMVDDTVYRLPKWWPWGPVVIGSVIMCVQFIGMIVENIQGLKKHHERFYARDMIPVVLIGMVFAVSVILDLFFAPISSLHEGLILIVMLLILFMLIGSGLWIFLSLGLTGLLGLMLFTDYPFGEIVVQVAFSANKSFTMTCLPLFIFMGELLFKSGASRDLYSGIGPWVSRVPGGLLHSNILSSTIFAAVSGSSAVTTATIGSIAVPELEKLGYDKGYTLGSLAGAGTLGLLIPPSIAMIVYGALTEQSIGHLFIAGVLPGLLLSALFMAYIAISAIKNPPIAPHIQDLTLKEKINRTIKISPIIFVVVVVLGLIYLGISTATEAGAIGALCALGVSLWYRSFSWENLVNAAMSTIRTTCMIMFIITGAAILSSAFAYLRIPQQLATVIVASGLPKYVVLGILIFIYLALGCIFEGISMMVLTLPIVYPVILKMGFDGIWFGVVLVMVIEVAQITPPVGFNLYVLQNISGVDIGVIVRHTIPFFLIMLFALIVIILFPNIALFFPELMKG
jgi:C4-dicarboxylate transporter, DctM subunit